MRLEMKCETNIGGKRRQRSPRIVPFIFVLRADLVTLADSLALLYFRGLPLTEENACPGHPVLLWSEAPTRT